ncbi:MAG: hypothetical protein ACO1QB_15395 [Verrucomicrobiales bacterium]
MKFLFRWAFRLLILAIVLGIGFILTKDAILKEVVESRIRQETGMDVRIGSLETGILNPTIHLENVTLFNTAEFGGSPFLVIPDLYIEYKPQQLGLQQIKVTLMRLEISNLHIVENEKGKTNLVQMLAGLSGGAPGSGINPKGESTFQGIDRLNLTVQKVQYTNLRNTRKSQEVKINLRNEVSSDLRTKEDFYGVLLKIFLRAGITLYLDDGAAAAPVFMPILEQWKLVFATK